MSQEKIDLRIGDLLVKADIISNRDLAEAMKNARTTGLPIGRILVMSGFVSEAEFQAAVHIQSLIRDSVLPVDKAIEALAKVTDGMQSLDEALTDIGWAQEKQQVTNKLGELLTKAGVVTDDSLNTAISTSESTGLPLGRILVSLGAISDEMLATALTTQILVRDGKVSRDQAIKGLKAALQRRTPVETALADQGFYKGPTRPSMRLGELLSLAGLVSEQDVMKSLEAALIKEQPLGQTLVDSGLITMDTLDAALVLQEMVINETLDEGQAAQCLKKIAQTGQPFQEALAHIELPDSAFKITVRLHDLLRVAGLIKHEDTQIADIEKFARPSSADAISTAKTLLNYGAIDERTYLGALRCYFLVAKGFLNIQQGIIALNYFHNNEGAFDDCLHRLGWTVATNPKTMNQMAGSTK